MEARRATAWQGGCEFTDLQQANYKETVGPTLEGAMGVQVEEERFS